jgi:2-acylglycerol O-acyltransferase 2
MGYHPHGIISVGAFGAFATDGAKAISVAPLTTTKDGNDESNNELVQDDLLDPRGFSSLFPGIDRRLITLPQNFRTPFLREYFLNMGACDSAKETFRQVLSRNDGVGNAVVVVVGGAAESMLVQPGSIDLVLDRRRGFVREAILADACLVNTHNIRDIILSSRISLAGSYLVCSCVSATCTGSRLGIWRNRLV